MHHAERPWQRAARGAGLLGADGALTPTIFGVMSALAAEHGAINLGQGFPDEDGPAEVLEAAREAIAGGVNQYPPARGILPLREAIATHQQERYGIHLDPERQVLVTAGATEGIAASLLALVDDGDEVVTIEPYYDAYAGLIGLAGGRHVVVPTSFPDFRPDHDRLRAAIGSRTRVILLNSPHNPTGAMLDRATLELIVELAERHDAVIVSDEVYEHLTFGTAHTPVAALPGAAERTITVSSAAKTLSVTGWKIGWITAPAPLVDAVLAVKQFLTYVNGAPFQPAVALGLTLLDTWVPALRAQLDGNRGALTAALECAGFAVNRPAGTYFLVADGAPAGMPDARVAARRLVEEAGVVSIPVSAFVRADAGTDADTEGYRSLLRFAYCKRPAVIAEASARIAALGN